jgi:hypothetical protein
MVSGSPLYGGWIHCFGPEARQNIMAAGVCDKSCHLMVARGRERGCLAGIAFKVKPPVIS